MMNGRNRCFVSFLFFLLMGGAVFAQSRDALLEYRNGNFEDAVSICRTELTANPGNLDAHVVICWSLIRLGRYQEALTYARLGRSLRQYDPRIVEILGEIGYYEGRNNDALQYFQEYINLAPEGARIGTVYSFIGEIYIRLGRFRHADIALSTAVHWAPNNAAWWVRLAYARENAKDFTEAISAYERALSLDARLPDARRGLERTRQALGALRTP